MVTRVAILGAGIGEKHLRAYLSLPQSFQVKLIVDKDYEKADLLAKSADCHAATDLQRALEDLAIDLIDICLPPHLHVPVALSALQAAKHVICEKPIATSLAELDEIQSALLSSTGQFFPVFQYRWGPSLEALRHLINLGLTGQPQVATIETHWNRGADYYAVDWRGTWAGEKGGAVLGHAIHNHDLLTHIMGPVASVSGITTTRINPIETEDCAALCFEMRNGALATSSITLGSATDESRFRFVFENLTAVSGKEPYAPGEDAWQFIARTPAHQNAVDEALAQTPHTGSGYTGLFQDIAKNLEGNQNNAVSFEEGRASIELVTAVYDAARTGARVTLPLSKNHPLYQGWQPQ